MAFSLTYTKANGKQLKKHPNKKSKQIVTALKLEHGQREVNKEEKSDKKHDLIT
jgi:hypothetical protein